MERTQVIEKIRETVVDVLDCDESSVVESASFAEDLGADSLDVVELVMAFEESFGSSIPDDKIESIKTVGDVADFFMTAK
ncbi:MAG: acyl carrier protein [Coriobacteriia bacterium]|nr:acyl carrier protein [Coriobacteriia bacterium]